MAVGNQDIEASLARLMASLSGTMLDLSKGPVASLQRISASPSASMEELASLNDSLTKLASFASVAASLASLMTSLKELGGKK